MKPSNMRKK